DGHGMQTMFTSDVDRDLIHSQFMTNSYNEGDASLKRKIWMESATGNASKFETGEASVTTTAKRFREQKLLEDGMELVKLRCYKYLCSISRCREQILMWKQSNRTNTEEQI
ncbi:LOW QUALITY PROTEIN: hypothetical protein HID58_018177, partial [Brassica napus]